MFDANFEPTIAEIMKEPAVRALMRADRVNPNDFEARLRFVSQGPARLSAPSLPRLVPIDRPRFAAKAMSAIADRCCG